MKGLPVVLLTRSNYHVLILYLSLTIFLFKGVFTVTMLAVIYLFRCGCPWCVRCELFRVSGIPRTAYVRRTAVPFPERTGLNYIIFKFHLRPRDHTIPLYHPKEAVYNSYHHITVRFRNSYFWHRVRCTSLSRSGSNVVDSRQ
jgi:hypothetical protein